jgi:hypothetical protein
MALVELSFADTAKLKEEGRNFDCSTCPKAIQKIRRCWEDRDDFTSEDGNVFPIYIHKGGGLYGFCPGKVSRDIETVSFFRMMVLVAETGNFPEAGGIFDQDAALMDELSWFLPAYDMAKWSQKMSMIFGGLDKGNKVQGGPTKASMKRR